MNPQIAVVLVYLHAPLDIEPSLVEAVMRERPQIERATDRTAADLAFIVERADDRLTLIAEERGALLESRELGAASDVEPAVRLAVLLIAEHVTAFEARTTTTATVAAPVEPEPPPPIEPRPEPPPLEPQPKLWRLEGGAMVTSWGSPFTPQLGFILGLVRRFDRFSLAVQVINAGLCCGVSATDIEASPQLFGLLIEGRLPLLQGASIVAAAGAIWEPFSARPIFVGETVPQEDSLISAVFRAGIRLEYWFLPWLGGAATAGAQVHPQDLQISLPNPPNPDRQALERGQILPFLDLTLAVELF